jgi:hypothetical protein
MPEELWRMDIATTASNAMMENMRMDRLYGMYGMRVNPATLSYESEHQSRRIRDLESQLQAKERTRQNDLQSIIGYFYKR